MEGQLVAHNLIHISKTKDFIGLSREDCEKLLGYIKSLELAFADLLRSTYEKELLE